MAKVKIKVDWDGNYAAAPVNEDIACVVTASTFGELRHDMAEALRQHIGWMTEEGDEVPAEFMGDYELEYDFTGRALVHYAEGFVDRAALAKASGINKIQLGHYSTGRSIPRPQQVERIKTGIRAIVAQLTALCL